MSSLRCLRVPQDCLSISDCCSNHSGHTLRRQDSIAVKLWSNVGVPPSGLMLAVRGKSPMKRATLLIPLLLVTGILCWLSTETVFTSSLPGPPTAAIVTIVRRPDQRHADRRNLELSSGSPYHGGWRRLHRCSPHPEVPKVRRSCMPTHVRLLAPTSSMQSHPDLNVNQELACCKACLHGPVHGAERRTISNVAECSEAIREHW